MSLDMFPRFAIANSHHRRYFQPILAGNINELNTILSESPHCQYVSVFQMALRPLLTFKEAPPTTRIPVNHVIELCANFQMIWVYAKWIIALMSNYVVLGYLAFMDLIRQSVGQMFGLLMMQDAVTRRGGVSIPVPAAIRLLVFLVEAGEQVQFWSAPALVGTKFSAAPFNYRGAHFYGVATGTASAWYFISSHLISPLQKLVRSDPTVVANSCSGRFYFNTVYKLLDEA